MITHESSLIAFEEQIQYALKEFDENKVPSKHIQNIVLCGLGGSGIGGRIARGYFLQTSHCPIEVYSDYFLPNYINQNTLVVLSSYSGNTEETLAMFERAHQANCQIIGICSGGELATKLKEYNLPFFMVPKGYQPRMALGFSLALNLLILGKIFGSNIQQELKDSLEIYANKDVLQQSANVLFKQWSNAPQLPIHVFCDEYYSGVATRFCQQVQENAKGQAFAFVLPEVNHNVTESIYGHLNANILFLNSGNNSRVNMRFKFLEDLLHTNGNSVTKIDIKGSNLKEILRIIYILDWASILLSNAKSVDNMSVKNIEKLKDYLK